MSLINNVLRELDQRRASDAERANVPNEVRPLPLEKKPSSGRLFGIVGLGAVALTAVWLIPSQPSVAPSSPMPIAAVPPAPTLPATAAAAEPPPGVAPVVAPVAAPAVAPNVASLVAPVSPPMPGVATHEPLRKMEAIAVKKDEPKPAVVVVEKDEPKPVAAEKPSRQAPVTAGTLKLDNRLSLRNLVPESAPAAAPRAPASAAVASPKNPENLGDAEVQRAEGMLRQGLVKEAEASLRATLTAAPAHIGGRQALLNLLINAKRSDEAVAVYQEGLVRHPAQTPWAMSLARLQADRNDYNAAWETLSRTLPHAQQQADYRAFCGAVMQRLNRPREAAEHYRAALTIKPTEARWWVGFGLALEGDRQIPDSREAFQRARQTGSLPPELAAFVDQKLR